MKRIGSTVLVAVMLLLFAQALMAECVEMSDEAADYEVYPESRAIHAKKIEYALSVISDQQYLKENSGCVAKALFFLGQFHVERAVPRMVELLSYEDKVVNPIHARMRNEEYPAIGGLAGIGKPAVPVLLKMIGKGETQLERENAVHAFMTIYSGHPAEAIRLLRKTADAEEDFSSATHLREAATKAQPTFCGDRDYCADPAD